MNYAIVTMLNNDGKQLWLRSYGDGDHDDKFTALQLTKAGSILAAGRTATYASLAHKNLWLLPLSAKGNLQ